MQRVKMLPVARRTYICDGKNFLIENSAHIVEAYVPYLYMQTLHEIFLESDPSLVYIAENDINLAHTHYLSKNPATVFILEQTKQLNYLFPECEGGDPVPPELKANKGAHYIVSNMDRNIVSNRDSHLFLLSESEIDYEFNSDLVIAHHPGSKLSNLTRLYKNNTHLRYQNGDFQGYNEDEIFRYDEESFLIMVFLLENTAAAPLIRKFAEQLIESNELVIIIINPAVINVIRKNYEVFKDKGDLYYNKAAARLIEKKIPANDIIKRLNYIYGVSFVMY
jgi:hypothetical protein